MLLTSLGDSGSSLSVDSSPPTDDSALASPSGIEGDRVTSIASLDTVVEVDRAPYEHTNDLASISTHPGANVSEIPLGTYTPGSSLLTQRSQHQGIRLKPLSPDGLDGLYALRQAGGSTALRRSRLGSWSTDTLAKLAETNLTEVSHSVSFAEPLSPLRERDLKALSVLFLRDDIYAIEADVKQRLLLLMPEPCWDDHIFDFLKELL